jgi:predicted dehydrogenase
VEKPAAASVDELKLMTDACRDARVAFLDGTMFHHHPRCGAMESAFRDESVFGKIGRVSSAFSFRGDDDFFADNIRTSATLERFGALGDLGQYSIRFGLWVFGWELPAHVRAVAHVRNREGVPMEGSATFSWPRGGPDDGPRTLIVDFAFTLAFRQWAEVVGTKARLRLEDFTISHNHDKATFVVTRDPNLDASHSNVIGEEDIRDVPGNQEAAMWKAFSLAAASTNPFQSEWATRSLKVQACLDAAMLSMANDGEKTLVPLV